MDTRSQEGGLSTGYTRKAKPDTATVALVTAQVIVGVILAAIAGLAFGHAINAGDSISW